MYELETESSFDSAHFLANYFGKCENLHGHRWRIVARIGANTLQQEGSEEGMVCDFAHFKKTVNKVANELDHTFLVEAGTLQETTIAALEQEGFSLTVLPFRTTAENLATHIYDRLVQEGFSPTSVEVDETPHNRAIYTPQP